MQVRELPGCFETKTEELLGRRALGTIGIRAEELTLKKTHSIKAQHHTSHTGAPLLASSLVGRAAFVLSTASYVPIRWTQWPCYLVARKLSRVPGV